MIIFYIWYKDSLYCKSWFIVTLCCTGCRGDSLCYPDRGKDSKSAGKPLQFYQAEPQNRNRQNRLRIWQFTSVRDLFFIHLRFNKLNRNMNTDIECRVAFCVPGPLGGRI